MLTADGKGALTVFSGDFTTAAMPVGGRCSGQHPVVVDVDVDGRDEILTWSPPTLHRLLPCG